jgi:ubiquinone/menaquinone biosynthesis C-methylase UbiE
MNSSVEEAFTKQSEIFDSYEEGNEILKWMRSLIRNHVLRYLKDHDKILELNSGTGLDAVFFAKRGNKIHCIDISAGMIKKLSEKIKKNNLGDLITFQNLSFSELDKLIQNSFDYIFSNFGGLNCTDDLSTVFKNFPKLLNKNGKITVVIMPKICPWELTLMIKGNFKTAFRRLHKNGITANIEDVKFQTYYYSVNDVIKALGPEFKILELQGLGSISPPPFMINFPKRYPSLYKWLTGMDEKISKYFPFNRCADHFILTAEYKPDKLNDN